MENAWDEQWKRSTLDKLISMSLKGTDTDDASINRTKSIINNLLLSQVQQVRYMHIALGCVSIALAIWIISRVWYDSWRATKLQVKLRPRKLSYMWELHPAESFPLVLGFTSFFSTLTFVVLQGLALQSVNVPRCVVSAQIIFPMIFALSYMHLVFGFEMTIRSLKKIPFQPRGKWTTPICLGVFVFLMIGTWVPTTINPYTGKCFGDIIWRPIKNSRIAVGIISGLLFAFLTMAAIIGIQLGNNKAIDMNERIAGSRMVYYLIASAVLQAFILPFFVQAVIGKFDSKLCSARIAEFMLFTSGLILALIHLILRANASLFAIKPKETPWMKKRRFRLFGPNDLEIITISAPLDLVNEGWRPDEKVQDIYARQQAEKGLEIPPPVTLPVFRQQTKTAESDNPVWPLPEGGLHSPRPASPKTPTTTLQSLTHKKKPSFSLFPSESELKLPSTVYSPPSASSPPKRPSVTARSATTDNVLTLPSTKYSPSLSNSSSTTLPSTVFSQEKSLTSHRNSSVTDVSDVFEMLQPPTRPWAQAEKHRRGSSTESSATVQIGIRFSTAPAAFGSSAAAKSTAELSSSQEQPPSPSGLQRSRSDPNRIQHLPANPRPANRPRENSSDPQDSRIKDARQPQQSPIGGARSPAGDAVRLNPISPPGGTSRAQRLYSPPLVKDGSNFF